MVVELSLYRNGRGELFFRLSPTHGRTGSYRVQAESERELERWLAVNGFRLVVPEEGEA
jgi:hypothetical protein